MSLFELMPVEDLNTGPLLKGEESLPFVDVFDEGEQEDPQFEETPQQEQTRDWNGLTLVLEHSPNTVRSAGGVPQYLDHWYGYIDDTVSLEAGEGLDCVLNSESPDTSYGRVFICVLATPDNTLLEEKAFLNFQYLELVRSVAAAMYPPEMISYIYAMTDADFVNFAEMRMVEAEIKNSVELEDESQTPDVSHDPERFAEDQLGGIEPVEYSIPDRIPIYQLTKNMNREQTALVVKWAKLIQPELRKTFSDSARASALEARRAKHFQQQIDPETGKADVHHMLDAISSRGTKGGDYGHLPGQPFNPARASPDEVGMLELHAAGLRNNEIADALRIPVNEIREKFKDWKLSGPGEMGRRTDLQLPTSHEQVSVPGAHVVRGTAYKGEGYDTTVSIETRSKRREAKRLAS